MSDLIWGLGEAVSRVPYLPTVLTIALVGIASMFLLKGLRKFIGVLLFLFVAAVTAAAFTFL